MPTKNQFAIYHLIRWVARNSRNLIAHNSIQTRPGSGLLVGERARADQSPHDRYSGEHRPGALVSEPRERHPLVALSRRRGDGVSGAGAGTRLDDRHVGRRLTLVGRRLELSQFSRGEVDGREEARAAAVFEERLPRVAHAGPAGDGDLRPAAGQTRQDAETRGYRTSRFTGEASSHRCSECGVKISW